MHNDNRNNLNNVTNNNNDDTMTIKTICNIIIFLLIRIGICDSVGGTPALEAILDFAKMIDDHNLYDASLLSELIILRVIALNNLQCLGIITFFF